MPAVIKEKLLQYKPFILPVLLIIFGWVLEIYYYWWRYTSDGIDSWVSLVSGIALTLFLSILTKFWKINPKFFVTIGVFLIVYSVFCTSAGQSYSLQLIQQENEREIAKLEDTRREANRIDNTILSLQNRYDLIEEQKNEFITTFDDRYSWKNTLQTAEDSQRAIQSDILNYRAQKEQLIDSVEIKPPDIYTYYSGLFGLDNKWLQFILQTLLSLFIAVMAPVGILIWPVKQKIRKPYVKQKQTWKDFIEPWVEINWTAVRANRTNPTIIPRQGFFDHARKHNYNFTDDIYDKIHARAIEENVVDGAQIILYDEKEAIRRLGG